MALKNTDVENNFVSILADGKLHKNSTQENKDAIKREYETSDGLKGEKWELIYTELTGIITEVKFYEGNYGKLIQLVFLDGEEEITLSVNVNTSFGEDIMKKIPAIDLKLPVKIVPYSFEDEKDKKRRGVTFYQNEKKVANFYYDPETKKNKNGYPDPKVKKGGKISNEEWKIYFMEVRLFLIEDIKKRFNIVEKKEIELEDLIKNF